MDRVLTRPLQAETGNPRGDVAPEPQIKFLSEDLRAALHGVGSAVLAANTKEEEARAFRPYADKLAALVRG